MTTRNHTNGNGLARNSAGNSAKRGKMRPGARKTACKTASSDVRLAPLPPNGGARLPLGNHPGNTGGKVGQGECEHCGKVSGTGDLIDPAKLVPTPDTRVRAAEITFKHTLPAEKVVRLEGFPGVQRAFDLVKERIRAHLSPDVAERVIEDIHERMAGL